MASFAEVRSLLDEGNKIRILACTNRNAQSSRSHTVFSIHITQVRCWARCVVLGVLVACLLERPRRCSLPRGLLPCSSLTWRARKVRRNT